MMRTFLCVCSTEQRPDVARRDVTAGQKQNAEKGWWYFGLKFSYRFVFMCLFLFPFSFLSFVFSIFHLTVSLLSAGGMCSRWHSVLVLSKPTWLYFPARSIFNIIGWSGNSFVEPITSFATDSSLGWSVLFSSLWRTVKWADKTTAGWESDWQGRWVGGNCRCLISFYLQSWRRRILSCLENKCYQINVVSCWKVLWVGTCGPTHGDTVIFRKQILWNGCCQCSKCLWVCACGLPPHGDCLRVLSSYHQRGHGSQQPGQHLLHERCPAVRLQHLAPHPVLCWGSTPLWTQQVRE